MNVSCIFYLFDATAAVKSTVTWPLIRPDGLISLMKLTHSLSSTERANKCVRGEALFTLSGWKGKNLEFLFLNNQ